MKIFPHKYLNGLKVSRMALRHYSLYRRAALGGDSSLDSLCDFHTYESIGKLPEGISSFTEFSKKNAYANGKWIMRLTQDQIQQDVLSGTFAKSEYINSCSLNRDLIESITWNMGKRPAIGPIRFKFSASGWFTEN